MYFIFTTNNWGICFKFSSLVTKISMITLLQLEKRDEPFPTVASHFKKSTWTMALNVRYLKLIFLIQIISVPHLLHFGKSTMQSCLLFVHQMSHNLRQNGRKVHTLSPFHNIKGGKMAHLDSCVASSMTLAGMGVCCSILFNPRLCFGQNTCI